MRRLARPPASSPFLRLVKPEPFEPVIKDLEDLLDKARKGEIQGVAFCFIGRGGAQETGWSYRGEQIDQLMAGVSLLQYRFAQNMDETCDEVTVDS